MPEPMTLFTTTTLALLAKDASRQSWRECERSERKLVTSSWSALELAEPIGATREARADAYMRWLPAAGQMILARRWRIQSNIVTSRSECRCSVDSATRP